MNKLSLVIAPDPILKQISKPVDKVDDSLRQFMKEMLKVMYGEHGVGLAAVQVGVLKRVVVMDIDYETDESDYHDHSHCGGIHVKNTNPRFFVNPEIITSSKEKESFNEGCLSFPNMRSEVIRPEKVTVKYLDFDGKEKTEEMTEMAAICIQHEIDHLNGIVFVDHVSKLKRDVILNKMKKLNR